MKTTKLQPSKKWLNFSAITSRKALAKTIALVLGISLLLTGTPAAAHHPFGGETPSNFFEGLLSGFGHPIIGPDHFAFVVAVGLLAAIKERGIFIPIAFVLTALAGTGIHLMSLDLPAPEVVISASVLLFGIMLALKNSPNSTVLIVLAAIAGLFHGYAYGEAIVGADMTPLVAYLTGFTLIQLAIALLAFQIGKSAIRQVTEQPTLVLRFAGFTIGGAGAAFLSSAILG
ncbi:MAG: hydantoin utilization protein A [Symploca sp. SIO2C1]|nr:hydantoin utilization protein A [Symploca sp. SIO2C1]